MVSEQQLKPQFFVTRQNGSMVALIAMDELPPSVKIRHVNRILSPHDISGMTGIGTYDTRHQTHIVEPVHPLPPLVDRSLTSSRFAGSEHHLNSPAVKSSLQTPPKAFGIQEQAPIAFDANTSQVDRATHALPAWHDLARHGLKHAPGTKEYCTYWLRHGECDFAQQGCLFKHEMPLDRAELDRIGLRDIPRWYREKHGITSYLAIGGIGSDGERKRKDIMTGDWRKGVGGKTNGIDAGNDIRQIGGAAKPVKVMPPAPPSTPRLPNRALVGGRRGKTPDRPIAKSLAPASINGGDLGETVRERQIRETLAQLNQYEEREAQRKKQLIEKMERLEAGKNATNGHVATVPEARPASGHSSSLSSFSSKRGEAESTPATSASEDEVEYATASEATGKLHGKVQSVGAKPASVQAIRSFPAVPSGQTKLKPKTSRHSRRRVAALSDDSSEGEKSAATKQTVQEPRSLLEFYDHDD